MIAWLHHALTLLMIFEADGFPVANKVKTTVRSLADNNIGRKKQVPV